MTDKEVGELWRNTQQHLTWPEPLAIEHDVMDLIRKLVEERAGWLEERRGRNDEPGLTIALRDFCIDPETWNDDGDGGKTT